VKTLKKIGDALNTDDEKGVIIAMALALIIISAVVAGYYVYHVFYQTQEGYTEIYRLDSQGNATDTLIVNQDYTFNVWVENHEGRSLPCDVQLKITNQSVSQFPVDVEPSSIYTKILANGEKWEIQANITLHETGSRTITFELWMRNDEGALEFTGNYIPRNVEVVNPP
jgi:uncharacterized membrane protein